MDMCTYIYIDIGNYAHIHLYLFVQGLSGRLELMYLQPQKEPFQNSCLECTSSRCLPQAAQTRGPGEVPSTYPANRLKWMFSKDSDEAKLEPGIQPYYAQY